MLFEIRGQGNGQYGNFQTPTVKESQLAAHKTYNTVRT